MKLFAAHKSLLVPMLFVMMSCDDGGNDEPTLPFELGDPIWVMSETVDSAGGVIEVTEPGPLQGLTIEVPEGAYDGPTTFEISYHPVESFELKEGFELVAPIIEIDNGGDYADDIVLVTVPAPQIPEEHLVLPFFYDDETGQMEAVVPMGQTETSFTFATRHFSKLTGVWFHVSFFRSKEFHTQFLPTLDGWWFANRGSVANPTGHSDGMTLGAGWYFLNRRFRQNQSTLVGSHGPMLGHSSLAHDQQTRSFYLDDDLAMRLVSAIETDGLQEYDWVVRKTFELWQSRTFLGGDPFQYYITIAALYLFEQPVYLSVYNQQLGLHHALLAWAFTDDFIIHVYDPNYADRWDLGLFFTHGPPDRIHEGYFDPYYSAPTADEIEAGRGLYYDSIQFAGMWCLHNSVMIDHRWTEMESGAVGAGLFPDYQLRLIEDGDESTLVPTSGAQVSSEQIAVELVADFPSTLFRFNYDDVVGMTPDANPFLFALPTRPIYLSEGDNLLGFYVEANLPQGARWAGFDWVHIERSGQAPCGDGQLEFDEVCDYSATDTGCAPNERCEDCERCVEIPSNRPTAQACSIDFDDIEVIYADSCPGWNDQHTECSCSGEFRYTGDEQVYLIYLVRMSDFDTAEVTDSWWEVAFDVSPASRSWNQWVNCYGDQECHLPDYSQIVKYGAFSWSDTGVYPCQWIFDEYRRNYDESGLPMRLFPADVCTPP